MKFNIHNAEGLIQLKRNQKLTPNKLYLIGSESVTNSLYFRRSKDIKEAHKLILQRLSGILEVVDYLFTPKGWILIIRLKSKSLIIDYYKRMRNMKQSEDVGIDAGRIISEVIRTFISSLVGFINRGSNRKGTMVYRVFKRFSIDNIDVVKRLLNKMKRKEVILSNQGNQFEPKSQSWKNRVLPGIGMSFLSSEEESEEGVNNLKDKILVLMFDIDKIWVIDKLSDKRKLLDISS